ncbi:hypothetical protein ACIGBH_40425 [Streptomyces sp. NPDC085929]|uniref:hypothetical protein n=1 Tax=Streptomyces sp. NPDC085929 TaxID=3365739 RepID=UPI0037D4B8B2
MKMRARRKALESEEKLREIGEDYLQEVAVLRQQAAAADPSPDEASLEVTSQEAD